jgi:voltage-dependent calcium channel L type alpha-1D
VWIVESKAFSRCILAVIVVNAVLLGFSDFIHSDDDNTLLDDSWQNRMLLQSEPVFTAVFAMEAALKIVAMGFAFEANTYLRDWWNVLDFLIMISA